MHLENLVVDAVDPQRLGRFWEAAVGGERLTDEPDGFETRLAVPDGPVLDLCFQRVADPWPGPPRLEVELADGPGELDRLLGLGARSIGADLLADPEGGTFRLVPAQVDAGPLVALRLHSADPERDAALWSWLTGWTRAAFALRHPSGRGPVLELVPEQAPKAGKGRRHLDVRLEPGDDPDAVTAGVLARGGQRFDPDWGDLPWTSYLDASGNELCVLRAP